MTWSANDDHSKNNYRRIPLTFAVLSLSSLLILSAILAALPTYAQSGSGLNISLSTEESLNPKVAATGNNVYVVWQENQGEGKDSVADIFFARSTDSGKTFSEPINLSNNPARSSIPNIAASGSNVYVVWGDVTPGNGEVFFAKSTDSGATFSDPENISNTFSLSINPKVAVTGSGGIIVVWTESLSLTNYEIFAVTSDDGGDSFGDVMNISDSGADSSAPAVASFAENVYLAWQVGTSGNLEIMLAKSTDGGNSFDDAVNISNTAGRSSAPQIAANDYDVYILWQEDSTIRLVGSSDWGSTFRSPTTVGDADSVQKPQIAASSSSVIVASGGDGDIMVVRSSDSGSTLTAPINVSNNDGDSSTPAIALWGSITYVVWQDSTSGNSEILFTYSVDGGATFLPIGTEAGEEEKRPITRLPSIPAECTTQEVIRTTSVSVTNTGDSEASAIYLHFPEGIRWVFTPGYDRYRISDTTVMLVADSPLAPNRSTEMLFVPEELDLDLETSGESTGELEGSGDTDTDVCGPFDGEDSGATLPSIRMVDPRLSFVGFVPPIEEAQIVPIFILDLPKIPLADLPGEFEIEIDCEPLTGESVGELQGAADGVAVGIDDLDVDFTVDEVKVDGVRVDSPDSGLPFPGHLFPIELEVDTELEGVGELEGATDVDDSFIEFIPQILGGSVGFNDKIGIKMHYDGDPKDATISPRAIISAPSGTSCSMSIDSLQESDGLPLPFTFDSALELPAGDSTIRIEPHCESDDCSMVLEHLYMTIDAECTLSSMTLNGQQLDILQAPLPPNKRVDLLDEAGVPDLSSEDSLTLTLEDTDSDTDSCSGEAELEGDGDTAGVTEGVADAVEIEIDE